MVRLQGSGEKCLAWVIDIKGRLVAAMAAVQRQFAFKDKPSGVYMGIVSGNDMPVTLRMAVP
jgi:hypothetical protein